MKTKFRSRIVIIAKNQDFRKVRNVQTINTPNGRVAIGATIPITWTYTPQPNPFLGTLRCINNSTSNTTVLSNTINLSTQSYSWTIDVPAGFYYLALNDGTGDKNSGTFEVQSINTPGSSVAVGALITITWSYTPQTNALPGTLSIIDSTTKNTVVISSTINLATKSYQWTVNVPAGTYYLALNDGS
ncbi:17721_t:CDS:2, partial [Cetraspora pellucida]